MEASLRSLRKQKMAEAIRAASPVERVQPTKSARRIVALRHRDGQRCWLCGEFLDFRLSSAGRIPAVTVDHVVPRSQGGPDAFDNLRLAHGKCNGDRSSAPGVAHPKWLADRADRKRRGQP